ILSTAQEYSYTMTAAATVKAVFESRTSLAKGALRINEFMASNDATIATQFGEYTDWFEIYNPGTVAVDVAGLYVSNTADNATLYQIPYGDATSTTIPAKGFLLLWANERTYDGITHVPFKLSKEGGVIILSQKNSSGAVTIIDSLHYGVQNTDISFGRYPDGNNNVIIFENPTPASQNMIAPMPDVDNIYITEILAKNASTNKEETGNYADWFELYNANNFDVDLGGLYVTNNTADLNMYQIPRGQSAKTTIPAKSYMIMWADKQPAINPAHVDFKINVERSQLALVQARGAGNYIIDSVSFSNQGEDIAYGRYPDVTSPFRYLATPTPAAANKNTAPAAKTGITVNEILAVNTSVLKAEDGKYYDYVEFYNAGSSAVDLGGLFVSDSLGYSLKYRIQRGNPAATIIQPNQWLTFFASDSASLGTRHFSFALNKDAEDFVLTQVTANGLEQIDYITFTAQSANVSYGRFPETADNWELMEPTPTAANISAESSVNLKTLLSSVGTIIPEVAKDVFEYECLLPSNVTSAPVISATAINERATVEITQATSIAGTARIVVTSANGLATAEYFVTFSNDPSGDASLKSLAANVGTIEPAFASDIYEYTLTFTGSTKPLFTAIATNPNSKVEVLYGANYSAPTIIRVTSENNTIQEYTINYKLNVLEVAQWVDDFSNGIDRVKQVSSHYTLKEKDGALHVHFQREQYDVDGYFEYALPENTVVNATKIPGNTAGKDLFVSIIAHTEDGTDEGITVSGTSIGIKGRVVSADNYEASNRPYDEGGFSVGLTDDVYEFSFSDSQIDKSKISTVRFVLDPGNTSSDKNKIIVIEKIVIGPKMDDVVELSNNADLATLTTSEGVVSPAFNADVLEYTVTLPAGTTTIPTIAATTADENARLQISQASSLNAVATVTVISEDVLVVKNYTVRFVVTPSVVDGHIDQILQPALLAWSEDSPMYQLSYSAGVLNVAYSKTGAGSPAIQYNTLAGENKILNLTNFPYFSVKLQSTVNTVLRAELYDADGKAVTAPEQQVAVSADYSIYTFDFSTLIAGVTANKIYGIKLYFDADASAVKSGTIVIDDVRFGRDVEIKVNEAPVIATIPAQTVEQTKAFEPINLNEYVTDDNTAVENLVWSVSEATNFTVTITNNVATITAKDDEWIGEERITFAVTDEDGVTAIRGVRFTVTKLIVAVEELTFAEETIVLYLGDETSIAAALTITPANATDQTIMWTSSNPLVVSVDETTGVVTALQEGEVTIIATAANGKTAQCTVEVEPILAETVTIIPASLIMQ
ncbi:MAG: lamin tail domain-containing protein, partial [Bacteroidales bacterium]|nr:lamin tail domain-containing protein [Bacteroidales bacterium]